MDQAKQSLSDLSIDERVNIQLAITRYLRAKEHFNSVSKEFTESCRELRKRVGKNARFVSTQSFKSHLVTSDGEGDFDIEPIESL